MAYNSTVTGEWLIDPPMTGPELRELPEFEWIRVRVEEEHQALADGGVVVHRWGVAVEAARAGYWSFYELTDELAKLGALVQPRALTGFIVRKGEEQGDVERYRWQPRGVFSERASLRWPDGTEAS